MACFSVQSVHPVKIFCVSAQLSLMAKIVKHCGLLLEVNSINILQHEESKVADGGVLLYILCPN